MAPADHIELVTERTNGNGGAGSDTTDVPSSSPTRDPEEDDDYEGGSTPDNGNDNPSTEQPSKCRGDDEIACSKNPNTRICDIQLCDGHSDCPDGEDEDDERCSKSESRGRLLVSPFSLSFHSILSLFPSAITLSLGKSSKK